MLRDAHTRDTGNWSQTDIRGHEAYMILPRGQIQVGDPGRPGTVDATAIQFLDSKKDDDGVAIGQLGGAAVICSKQETHLMQWGRTPRGTVPTVVSTEHGCCATNSMVNFDGGLAWMDSRGPMAMGGSGLEWVGNQIQEDFQGADARYAYDSKGMMRHCWGAHDKARGLVFWGLVTTDSTHELSYKGVSATFANHSDEARSRFPCNEVLVWSYRANAFTTWHPPAGLEVLWMRELTLDDGSTRMCFLAADGRIYAFDEEWSDTNGQALYLASSGKGSGTSFTTTTTFGMDTDGGGGAAARANGTLLRDGMRVVQLDSDGNYLDETTVASADPSTLTVTFAKSMTWAGSDIFEFGHRPELTIETTYVGNTGDVTQVNSLHVRYHLLGGGKAFCNATSTTHSIQSLTPTEVGMSDANNVEWRELVAGGSGQSNFEKIGMRRILENGKPEGSELNFKLRVFGKAGVSIADIMAEVDA